jgi:hypothetical protein
MLCCYRSDPVRLRFPIVSTLTLDEGAGANALAEATRAKAQATENFMVVVGSASTGKGYVTKGRCCGRTKGSASTNVRRYSSGFFKLTSSLCKSRVHLPSRMYFGTSYVVHCLNRQSSRNTGNRKRGGRRTRKQPIQSKACVVADSLFKLTLCSSYDD